MKRLYIVGLFVAAWNLAFAQNIVTGKIIDYKDKKPIVGATVKIKGANIGTVTDLNGQFRLSAKVNDTLIINFVGYQHKIVPITREALGDIIIVGAFSSTMAHASSSATARADSSILVGYSAHKNLNDHVPVFPWPPPDCSSQALVPKEAFRKASTLADVDNILNSVLDSLAYYDKSYFYIPNGFALVTRIEQIQEDGTSLEPPQRWSVKITAYHKLDWSSYLKALLFPPKGYFRIIVFAVTDQPFASSGKKISNKTAQSWLREGLNTLPSSIGEKKYNKQYNCTALIYEFKKVESEEATLLLPSTLTGADHLRKSKIALLLNHH